MDNYILIPDDVLVDSVIIQATPDDLKKVLIEAIQTEADAEAVHIEDFTAPQWGDRRDIKALVLLDGESLYLNYGLQKAVCYGL